MVDQRASGSTGRALEAKIMELLAQRDEGKTICVSEAARAVYADAQQSAQQSSGPAAASADDGWRELMEPARQAARRLVSTRDVVITQGGRIVDPSTAKGPIRVRRRTR